MSSHAYVLSWSVTLTLLRLHGLWPARLLCPWDSPGQNTGVGCHFLLQGIFPTQGWNPGLLPWQRGFFTTEPPGKPALICDNLHDFVVDKMNVIFYIRLVPFKARAPLIAQFVKSPPAMQEIPVQFLGWEDPLENG